MITKYRTIIATLSKGLLPETQAVIDRAVLEGFTLPSPSTILALNEFIKELILTGYWSLRDLILLFSYNDLACIDFSRINIKNPTGNLATFGVGHNYLLEGSQGGGISTSFVNTNWNFITHGINYTLNNASREAVVYTPVANAIIDGANGGFNESMRLSAAQPVRINSGTSGVVTDFGIAITGYKAVNRTSSTDISTVVQNTLTPYALASSAETNANQYIHRGNFLNGTNTIAYYSIGAEVEIEGQLLRVAMNNFLTAIGLSAIA